jgi:phosphoribosylanthranilate isomerase
MRDSDNALVAATAGADFLGFVFVEGVRRQLLPPQGRAIIERFRHEWSHDAGIPTGKATAPRLVGLFRNQPADWVKGVIDRCELDVAQLCGDEDSDYGRSLGVPVLRQIRVRQGEAAGSVRARVDRALAEGEMVHLDTDHPGVPGGSGVAFDWASAGEIAGVSNVLLSGGLNPGNVVEAIARVRPWGVDVSSGVETGGQKDAAKIREFIRAARSGT